MTGNVDNHQDETAWETEILLNAPLSSSCILTESDNPVVNLQRFVTSAVPQFGEELDVCINRSTDILPQV